MKHPSLQSYLEALDSWDKKHHLKGNTDSEILCSQSIEAFEASSHRLGEVKTLVDVGAGNGILGFPIFLAGLVERVVFIEPLSKRASFLLFYASSLPEGQRERVLVLNERLEKVSREKIERFAQNDLDKCLFCARAFSGNLELAEVLAQSELSDRDVFDFFHDKSSMDKPFMLRHLKA